jgi:hypothetical protein
MSVKKEKISGKMIEVSIKSTSLNKATYDALKENLRVSFVNGSIYEYQGVPSKTFTQGKFLNASIAKAYKYKKVRTI